MSDKLSTSAKLFSKWLRARGHFRRISCVNDFAYPLIQIRFILLDLLNTWRWVIPAYLCSFCFWLYRDFREVWVEKYSHPLPVKAFSPGDMNQLKPMLRKTYSPLSHSTSLKQLLSPVFYCWNYRANTPPASCGSVQSNYLNSSPTALLCCHYWA